MSPLYCPYPRNSRLHKKQSSSIITGRMPGRGRLLLFGWLRVDFEFFCPTGATCWSNIRFSSSTLPSLSFPSSVLSSCFFLSPHLSPLIHFHFPPIPSLLPSCPIARFELGIFGHPASFAATQQCLWFLVMAALCNRGAIIFLPCSFFLLSSSIFYILLFFPRLISAAGDWMSAILPHMVWP